MNECLYEELRATSGGLMRDVNNNFIPFTIVLVNLLIISTPSVLYRTKNKN